MTARSHLGLLIVAAGTLGSACRASPDRSGRMNPPARQLTGSTTSVSSTAIVAPSAQTSKLAGSSAPGASASARREVVVPAGLDTAAYPWHADPSLSPPPAVDHLEQRFAPPAGFTRVRLEDGSFGRWLRRLPLAAPSTPVKAFDGRVLCPPDHPYVAAVSTLDIGTGDLQQCADAVMRLHAEWSWSRGRRDMSYRAASGLALPFSRWARGERVVPHGRSIRWQPAGRAGDDHRAFRKYLDAVFSWANTVSLERQAAAVEVDQLRPGDFMVLPGNPGHTVLVLDLARSASGGRVALLGQSYMPAQSFHVLRPGPDGVWFTIDPESAGVRTPFWPAPFPFSSLRRLD